MHMSFSLQIYHSNTLIGAPFLQLSHLRLKAYVEQKWYRSRTPWNYSHAFLLQQRELTLTSLSAKMLYDMSEKFHSLAGIDPALLCCAGWLVEACIGRMYSLQMLGII